MDEEVVVIVVPKMLLSVFWVVTYDAVLNWTPSYCTGLSLANIPHWNDCEMLWIRLRSCAFKVETPVVLESASILEVDWAVDWVPSLFALIRRASSIPRDPDSTF